MGAYNLVVLMGNLTRDPEVRFTPSGVAVASFGLAVNNRYKKDGNVVDEVSFFDVEAWQKTAELCGEYLAKGRPVLIQGRLKQERWEDDHGNKRSKIKVVATAVQFLGTKDDKESAPAGAAPAGAAAAPEDDDIPF
ncbi:MAG: single-stranded DNA-binding protein [Deltaproteobacteria bacterium]|nr:single-stranded DNA-binding protein [Deltaproteobacteria bacterium]